MLLYLFDFRKVFFEGASKSLTAFFTVKTLGFLLPWIYPWFLVGSLISPPHYAESFRRNPRFLVFADFFPWFLKIKTNQFLGFLQLFSS
jgi:hypothetical protein